MRFKKEIVKYELEDWCMLYLMLATSAILLIRK